MKIGSPLTKLAEWIQSRDVADLSAARFDKVKQHIVDTVAARVAELRTDEGAAIGRLGASMQDRVVRRCWSVALRPAARRWTTFISPPARRPDR